MIYLAKLHHVNVEVAGEVILNINGVDLSCFAFSSIPQDVKMGEIY